MQKTILLLGSGELGKELTIALARLGHKVIAVDCYDGAPAQQVTPFREVVDMLDGAALDALVAKHKPDLIVPEIEAIRTERLYDYERNGIQVVPSATAANYTMNRRAIRDLAAGELKLATARFQYAQSETELRAAVDVIGLPCVVKPLMSSSGKGQSTVRTAEAIGAAWDGAVAKGRGDTAEVIVESLVDFDTEITLLTVTQKDGETVFCPPIGHRQERGDYQESWMPCAISDVHLAEAQRMARAITSALGGAGIWGVEFFLTEGGVIFSELSPRPHDTGMVTLANCLPLNQFELHARAILGLPIPPLALQKSAASAVILADFESETLPTVTGIEAALEDSSVDVRIFGKPKARVNRRMGVAVTSSQENVETLRSRAVAAAAKIQVGDS